MSATDRNGDVSEIRSLIERWARAVHAGDLETVLADHADDIVMFDVPPPEDGVRGIDAYHETWPPFFEWQRRGAVFEIVRWRSPADADVASRPRGFAAELPSGLERTRRPPRLTLTAQDGGRWVEA